MNGQGLPENPMRPDTPAQTPLRIARGMLDIDAEIAYWRGHYARTCPAWEFAAYEPAIRLGIQACLHAHGRSFEEVRAGLGDCYDLAREGSALEWKYARAVALASWLRIEQADECVPDDIRSPDGRAGAAPARPAYRGAR